MLKYTPDDKYMNLSYEYFFYDLDPEDDWEKNGRGERYANKLRPEEQKLKAVARFLLWNALTNVERRGWHAASLNLAERDSLADHSFTVSALTGMLVMLAQPSQNTTAKNRREQIAHGISMGNQHDFFEKLIPDSNTFLKRDVKEQVRVQEEAAMTYLFKKFLEDTPTIKERLIKLFAEEDAKKTTIAQLMKIADTIDAQVWRAATTSKFHSAELSKIMETLKLSDPRATALKDAITEALQTQCPAITEKMLLKPILSDTPHDTEALIVTAALLQGAKTIPHEQFLRAQISKADLPSEAYLGSLALSVADLHFRDQLEKSGQDLLPEVFINIILDTLTQTAIGNTTQGWTETLSTEQAANTIEAIQNQRRIIRARLMSFFPPSVKASMETDFNLDHPLAQTIARTARLVAYHIWSSTLPQGYNPTIEIIQAVSRRNVAGLWRTLQLEAYQATSPLHDSPEIIKELGGSTDALLKTHTSLRLTPDQIAKRKKQIDMAVDQELNDIYSHFPTT